MVERVGAGGAGGGVEDAGGVEHEVLLRSDGDGDDAAGGSGLQRRLVGGDVGVAGACAACGFLWVGVALAGGGVVGVVACGETRDGERKRRRHEHFNAPSHSIPLFFIT